MSAAAPPTTDDAIRAARGLIELATPLGRLLAERFARMEEPLTYRQYRILQRVVAGASTVTELARLANVSVATASTSVEALVQRGLLSKRQAEHDRRSSTLAVTPSGTEAMDAAAEVVDAMALVLGAELADQLDADELLLVARTAEAALAHVRRQFAESAARGER